MKINQSNYNFTVLENNDQGSGRIKVGQVIQAKIQQIMKDTLLLEMKNGKTIEAKTTILPDYKKNEVFKFVVKETNKDQITIQPILDNHDKKEIINSAEKKIINLLKTLDIKQREEEITLVKQLLANKIPASKENILKVIQFKTDFEKLSNLLDEKAININEKILNENIRQVVKEVLKGRNSFNKTGSESSIDVSDKELFNTELGKNGSDSTVDSTTKQNVNLQNLNIKDTNFEKIIFLLKNNLNVNISNITDVNNLILKDATITQRTDNLVELLNENEETKHFGKGIDKLLNKMNNMILEKKFEPQEIIKEMYMKLELIKKSIENMNPKNREEILNNITSLKNSLDFVNNMNQFQTYLQIPMILNDERKNLELFISKDDKKSKKINPKDVKILVALDTKTMDKVQALVEIKDKNITCNFKVTTFEAKEIFEKYENQLKKALILLGFSTVNTKYVVSEGESNILDIDINNKELAKKINFIDVKV